MANRKISKRVRIGGIPTIKVLRGARKLVANPKTWTREADAKTADGDTVDATNTKACRFCAEGAIIRSANDLGLNGFYAYYAMKPSLSRLATRLGLGAPLAVVNDKRGRRAALSVIDAAIRELGYTP